MIRHLESTCGRIPTQYIVRCFARNNGKESIELGVVGVCQLTRTTHGLTRLFQDVLGATSGGGRHAVTWIAWVCRASQTRQHLQSVLWALFRSGPDPTKVLMVRDAGTVEVVESQDPMEHST